MRWAKARAFAVVAAVAFAAGCGGETSSTNDARPIDAAPDAAPVIVDDDDEAHDEREGDS